jgi:predicted ATPase/DNA-binding SARP family transcriptional activator
VVQACDCSEDDGHAAAAAPAGHNRGMRFGILGPTQVRRSDGREITVGGPRLRALLALLLVDAGKVVTLERLIDGVYGGNPPGEATNALQSQVSRLRHLLRDQDRPGSPVEFHPAGYRLAVEADEVDAHRFERLAAEGRRALAAGDPPRAASLLREALDLWRGPALADAGDVPFAQAQAVRLEELRVSAVEDRVEAELALGGPPTLVAELEQLVAAYPLRERLRGQLMRALSAGGRQAEALNVFEEARRTLAEELGADPSPQLAAVHLAVLRTDPSLARPAEREAALRRRLPAQLTSFVGRTEEVRRVGKLLAEARLVTLTGPGGAGKTRLAIEAADREPGDVCFVDLVPVGEGADVPLAMLDALGLRDAALLAPPAPGPPDATGRLVAALADRRVLLVLDNCEHVVEAAARLSHRLLSACPMLRILATSREPLGITGETLWPVPPLPLPPPGATPAEALGYPTVRLFADRAAAVRPDFAVDPANADAVLRICRALDGLPLAIELAAARLRALSLAEVAGRLDDRFRLLSRGDRTAQPRHQTLRAVVEWSWDLLDDAEQTLARRLTVFAGAATREAAERVCGLPAAEVDELLASLADKSLVEAADGDGRRYRMLDTVRVFCGERLAEAGEWERLRRAHAAHFLDLAQTADRHLRGAEQLAWLGRLDADRDDLHAALRRAVDAADTTPALRLLAALGWYWWLRGRRSQAAALAGDLLGGLGPGPPAGLEEEYALCVLYASVGATGPDLRVHLEAAQSIVYAIDRPARQPFLTVLSALAAGPPGEEVDVRPVRQRLLTGPDPWIRALMRFGDGYLRLVDGQAAAAEQEFAAALAGFRAIGERWGMAAALAELAGLADWRGDRDRSIALTDEALDLAGQLDSADDMADLLCRCADASVRAGDLDGAHADYGRAAELARRAGTPEHLAAAHRGLGGVARLRGDLAESRRLCELALAECPTGWFVAEATRAEILVALGQVAAAEGDAAAARAWHRQALAALGGHWGFPVTAGAAEGLAGVALLEGDDERAALLLGVGAALRGAPMAGDPDVARVAAAARARIGEPAYQRAYRRGAAMTRDQARALLGAPPSAAGA